MGTHEHDRNPTQERMDEEGTEDVPVDTEWDVPAEDEGGTGADDGGPGSQNM
jgi:hypothetical protein